MKKMEVTLCLILCRDRKRKKFVSTEGSRPKKIKTESGIYISASYKSNLYLFNQFSFGISRQYIVSLVNYILDIFLITTNLTGHGMIELGELIERDDVSENTNSIE